jgi:hypothetical protein
VIYQQDGHERYATTQGSRHGVDKISTWARIQLYCTEDASKTGPKPF